MTKLNSYFSFVGHLGLIRVSIQSFKFNYTCVDRRTETKSGWYEKSLP